MDAVVFLARSIWAVPSCCRILLNVFQQSNGSGMLQGSGRKRFFPPFYSLVLCQNREQQVAQDVVLQS